MSAKITKGTQTATVVFTIKILKIEMVTIDPKVIKLTSVGETRKLSATVIAAIADQNVNWYSSNPEVATVATDGTVTAVKTGTATITAVSKENAKKEGKASVEVVIPPQSINLNTTELNFTYAGQSNQLLATVLPLQAPQNITWISSDNSVATVLS